MISVGVRDLKNRFSEYLRRVDAGETVLITHHDRVVAMLGPPPSAGPPASETEDDALDRLERMGLLVRGRGVPHSVAAPPLPRLSEPVDLQALLDESRKDPFEP